MHAKDTSLRPLALGPSSVVVVVESSRAGLATFKGWYREEFQPRIGGLDLLDVIEVFGAGIQARASEVVGEQPEIEIGKDLLLFPSKLSFAKTSSAFSFNSLGKPDITC